MKLHPFKEVCAEVDRLVQDGFSVYQQFNCQHCGAKQTMDVANVFHKKGICEECDSLTDIEKDGCNYLLIASLK